MRRIALVATAAAALACGGQTVNDQPGPLDRFFFPTGLGVLGGKLVVASSNSDLTYASSNGGSVISASYCEMRDRLAGRCTTDVVAGGIDIESFSGQLAVADPASCEALATAGQGASVFVPIRGPDFVYRLAADASGALTCDGCEVGVGSSQHGDPFSASFVCGPGLARAYVGYLRQTGGSWLTQIDLLKEPGDPGYVLHRSFTDSGGQVRGIAYDALRNRVYFTRTATGALTALGYVDLANGCAFDVASTDGGCFSGISVTSDLPEGLELRGVALANAPAENGRKRAYLTARIYDASASANAGYRVGDFDGLLLVVDLWDDLYGRLRIDVLERIPIGYGAGEVRVFPQPPWRAGMRDVVAAISTDDGNLWIYDDETGASVALGRNLVTGAPVVGHEPTIAVDPALHVTTENQPVFRVYVGAFRESWVTPVDVDANNPDLSKPVEFPVNGRECTEKTPCVRRIGPQLNQPVVIP